MMKNQAIWASGLVLALGSFAYSQVKQQSKRDKLFYSGLALMNYAQDYDGKLPIVSNQKQAKDALYPYMTDSSYLVPRKNKNYFAFNLALSGKDYTSLDGKNIVAFYEVNPAPKQNHGVLFLPPYESRIADESYRSEFVKYYIKELDKLQWKAVSQKQHLLP